MLGSGVIWVSGVHWPCRVAHLVSSRSPRDPVSKGKKRGGGHLRCNTGDRFSFPCAHATICTYTQKYARTCTHKMIITINYHVERLRICLNHYNILQTLLLPLQFCKWLTKSVLWGTWEAEEEFSKDVSHWSLNLDLQGPLEDDVHELTLLWGKGTHKSRQQLTANTYCSYGHTGLFKIKCELILSTTST